jgi:hypothetical protein
MKFIKFNKVLAISALICMTGAVGAATYNFGTLNSAAQESNIQINGSFNDYFSFVAGKMPSVFGSMDGLVAADGGILGPMTINYRVGVGATPSWGSFSNLGAVPQDPNTGTFVLSNTFNGLTAGQTYWANLTGFSESASYAVTLLPVPEPETYVMLLMGLGLMGVIARQRNRRGLGT